MRAERVPLPDLDHASVGSVMVPRGFGHVCCLWRLRPSACCVGALKVFVMNRRLLLSGLACVAAQWSPTASFAAEELRVMVHSSFSLPKPVLASIEAKHGVKLSIVKGGDAGEMLNKLILTRAKPIADVVFGLDNTLVGKALASHVLEQMMQQM